MKRKNIIYLLLIILGVNLTSCKDYLEETSQDLSYVNNLDDLDELLLGEVYLDRSTSPSINDATDTFLPYVHFMADELGQLTDPTLDSYSYPNTAKDLFGYYAWQRDVSMGYLNSDVYDDANDWTRIYESVIGANVVLAELENISVNDEDEKLHASRIKGEALFNRAADFFLLVNLFGDAYEPDLADEKLGIPLKMTSYVEIGEFTRATLKEVYAQILKDLTTAEECLRETETLSIYRINHAGVCLFLSRVYLYMQDYNNAITWAQKCIDEAPDMEDLNSYSSNLFNEDNQSILFTMGGNIVAENIYEVYSSVYESIVLGLGNWTVSDELYNLYDDNDLRKTNFFHVADEYPNIAFYDKQYSDGLSINAELSDCFTLRTAEAWLNLAEAYAVSNNKANAQDAINTLLQKRISADSYEATTLTGSELVHFIRNERRKELCMEGHRWFDLRRYQVNTNYPETKTLYSTAVVWEDYVQTRVDYYKLEPNDPAWTLPIPKDEKQYNTSAGNERYEREPYKTESY